MMLNLLFGFILGILFMSILYTLLKALYTRSIAYLAYSIMQVFSALYILYYSHLIPYNAFYQELSLAFATIFAVIFSLAFAKGQLKIKIASLKDLFVFTGFLIVILATSLYHYVLFEYLPYTVVYALLFLFLVANYQEEMMIKGVYVAGWSVICLLLYFTDFKLYYESLGLMDLVLLAFAIEAVLFTLSVAYSYKDMQQQMIKSDEMLMQQSRLAKSGQMIGNITHQFRQPLNSLSYILMNIKGRFDKGKLDEVYMTKKLDQANEQLQFMSKTIEDFKSFYEPSKIKSKFLVKEAIEQAITIISPELKRSNIKLEVIFDVNDQIRVFGVENELSQIIVNLLSNARDALQTTQNGQISIKIDANSAEVMIEVIDNGDGIKEPSKIFEPYYSTKQDGFGIGLYLVKTIIQKSFNGKIEARNLKTGALLRLTLEKA